MNGYTERNGQKYLWIGKRSQVKPTYPGMLDHLVAGGLVYNSLLPLHIFTVLTYQSLLGSICSAKLEIMFVYFIGNNELDCFEIHTIPGEK